MTDQLSGVLRGAADQRAAQVVLLPASSVVDSGRRRRRRHQATPLLAVALLCSAGLVGLRLASDKQEGTLVPSTATSPTGDTPAPKGIAVPIADGLYTVITPQQLNVLVPIGGGCYSNPGVAQVSVKETHDKIVLRALVVGRSEALPGPCPAVAQVQQIVITLASPVAGRQVLDEASGHALRMPS